MKKKIKECFICKKIFEKIKTCSVKNWDKVKYCSKKCYTEAQKLGLHKNALGYKHTEETKKHLSEVHIGKIGYWLGKDSPFKGHFGSKRLDIIGKNNPNWNNGSTLLRQQKRHSIEYKEWRRKVFERDDFTCQICSKRGIYLEPHHIKSWEKYPELRYSVENGQTLCKTCHSLIDKNRFRFLSIKEKQIYAR